MAGAQDAEALFARGAAALEAGDLAGADRIFRALVAAHPRLHAGWNALSVVAIRAGEPALAEAHARRALELERRNALYLNNLGVALGELGRFGDAETELRRALKLKPVYAEGLFNLGKVLHKQGRLADALRAYERAYAMDREFPGLRLALAVMYQLLGKAGRGLELMREHLQLDDRAACYYATMLAEVEGVDTAVPWMKATLSSNPAWSRLRYALALELLATGQWREGWDAYRSRPSVPPHAVEPLPASLGGKRIALRAEQGLGDVLFFLRFAPALSARGAHVMLDGPAKLDGVVAMDRVAEVDREIWLGDLPFLLGAEDVPPPFALTARPRRLEGAGPYLALTWRAGTDTLRQREHGAVGELLSKEIDLRALGQALRGWKGTVIALQRNPAAQEIEALSQAIGAPVHDLSALNEDLPAMLGVLDAVDEYVTVSNTNVHLRAGLGKPARVLVPYPAEWRWMRGGDASPWFPGSPIYRQAASRDWSEALARLRSELSVD
jgi:Tfp pilus assembly protein PilF